MYLDLRNDQTQSRLSMGAWVQRGERRRPLGRPAHLLGVTLAIHERRDDFLVLLTFSWGPDGQAVWTLPGYPVLWRWIYGER